MSVGSILRRVLRTLRIVNPSQFRLNESARSPQQRLRQRLDRTGGVVKVERSLGIKPEVRSGIERGRELDCDCWRHLGPFVNDSVDHFKVAPDVIRQLFLGDV